MVCASSTICGLARLPGGLAHCAHQWLHRIRAATARRQRGTVFPKGITAPADPKSSPAQLWAMDTAVGPARHIQSLAVCCMKEEKGYKAANGCAHPTLQRLSKFFTAQGSCNTGKWREAGSPVPCGCVAIQCSHRLLVTCQRRHQGRGWGGCRHNNQEMLSNTFLSLLPHLLAPANTKPGYTPAAQLTTSLCPAA